MLQDLTYNYTRAMLRACMKHEKPYVLAGIYQKHNDESERITFTHIHPYVPGKGLKETCRLFDHVHVFRENLDAVCPEWRSILKNGERYCLVCYSRPYRDKNSVRRCSINLTTDACIGPIIEYKQIKDFPGPYDDIINRQCLDWKDVTGGKWIKETESVLYSATKFVQDNARHRKKVEREKARKKKKDKRKSSIWRVMRMKVS